METIVTTYNEDGSLNAGNRVPVDWFEEAKTIKAPRLRGVDAYIEAEAAEIRAISPERAEIICGVRNVEIIKIRPAYSRAIFAVIEAVIHATRIREFLPKGKMKEVSKLMRLIRYYQDLVRRVEPNSVHLKTINELVQRVNSWMVER